MNNLNSILLEGNLCRDPELRYTPSDGTSPGTPTCTLVVSSVRTCKREGERHEEVSFVEAVTWGKLATVCAEHLQKGRGVRVVGRIKQERWEDTEGESRSKVVIVARTRRVSARAGAPPNRGARTRGHRQLGPRWHGGAQRAHPLGVWTPAGAGSNPGRRLPAQARRRGAPRGDGGIMLRMRKRMGTLPGTGQ